MEPSTTMPAFNHPRHRHKALEIDTSRPLPAHMQSPLTSSSIPTSSPTEPAPHHHTTRSASVSSPFGFPLVPASSLSARRRPSNLVLTLPALPAHLQQSITTASPRSATPNRHSFPALPKTAGSPQTGFLYSPLESPNNTAFSDNYFGSINGFDNADPAADAAYPDGPVEIYGNCIYLSSEPTVSTASGFDVIINVAREVPNPFDGREQAADRACAHADGQYCGTRHIVLPLSPPSIPGSDSSSPISPVNISQYGQQSSTCDKLNPTPEYIFVPWDHNSKLTPDLPYLTTVIARRAAEGKRVLVHCQCGVSRSASLVVAFVMKEKGWDLNTAYAWVKRKAPAIGPNMSLIYQLMEWGRILKGGPYELRDEDDKFVAAPS